MTIKVETKDVYTEEHGRIYDDASISGNPVSSDTLLDMVAEQGVGPGSLVLDVGCANGGVSRKLLQRTQCRIEGVELLPFLVDMGRKENETLGVPAERFNIRQGSITAIPFADETFDFVFCNDVIGLVEDLDAAFTECRRVLKPGGKMLIYASFATDRMSAREAQDFVTYLGSATHGLELAHAEKHIKKHFTVISKTVIGSQFTQSRIEKDLGHSEAAQSLLTVARLLTWPDKFIAKYGEKTYRMCLAGAQWVPFILLGKLQPTVFMVKK